MNYLKKCLLLAAVGTLLTVVASANGIGDYVWYDSNCDGLQNDGVDAGTPGVTVNLYKSSDNSLLATMLTSPFSLGWYAFYFDFNQIPGIDPSQTNILKIEFIPPTGYVLSPPNQGSNDAIDSDPDPVSHITQSITVPPYTEDQTWDAGLCKETTTVGEGFTPGYWRNHLEDWEATGYSQNDDFDTIFGTNYFNHEISLVQAINLGGGGLNKVARHGTAALLNAAHPDVDYPYTVSEVIAFVQTNNVDPLVTANELGGSIP